VHVKCCAHELLGKSTCEYVITCDSLIVVDKLRIVYVLFVVENGVVLLLTFLLKYLKTKSRPSRHDGGIARLSSPTVVIEGVDLSSQVVVTWYCDT
jgi:hypothetical protein